MIFHGGMEAVLFVTDGWMVLKMGEDQMVLLSSKLVLAGEEEDQHFPWMMSEAPKDFVQMNGDFLGNCYYGPFQVLKIHFLKRHLKAQQEGK